MRDPSASAFQVGDIVLRIADRLDIEGLRLRPDRLLERSEIVRRHEVHLDAEPRERVLEQVVRAAVEVIGRHDLVAGLGDVEQRDRDRRLATRGRERTDTTVELREPLFEHIRRRVHQPRVDVPELLEREQVRRVLAALELIGGGLMDRHRARARGRVGHLAAVEGDGFGAIVRHRASIYRGPPPSVKRIFVRYWRSVQP